MRLYTPDLVIAKENVMFLGPPGTGKTHCAHCETCGSPDARPTAMAAWKACESLKKACDVVYTALRVDAQIGLQPQSLDDSHGTSAYSPGRSPLCCKVATAGAQVAKVNGSVGIIPAAGGKVLAAEIGACCAGRGD